MALSTPKRIQEHVHTCEFCMQVFHSSRYDARYCSPKCRKAASRAEAKVFDEATKINNALDRYIAMYAQGNKLTRSTACNLLESIARRASQAADVWRA